MHDSVLDFVSRALPDRCKDVLEVGSRNVNGSARERITAMGYVGVDIEDGPDVDLVCSASDLIERFPEGFDVVVTTEMLEHVEDWRSAVGNLKGVTRPGGVLVVTTRSEGFPYHEHPGDFWRYSADDMRRIFADWDLEMIEDDHQAPGVFVKARRPLEPREPVDLSGIEILAMLP